MAVASKVNALPVFGVIILAGIGMLITNRKKTGFRPLLRVSLPDGLRQPFLHSWRFRIFQPYAVFQDQVSSEWGLIKLVQR